MLQTFSYNKQGENFNAIIDTAVDHALQNMESLDWLKLVLVLTLTAFPAACFSWIA